MNKLLMISGLILGAAGTLLAGVVTVDGRSDIFEAGLGTPGFPVGGTLGFFPTLGTAIVAGAGQTITFSNITGTVKWDVPDAANGGDGAASGTGTAITSNSGISGIVFNGRVFFLVGVFLDNNTPAPGTQPSGVTFTSAGANPADTQLNWSPFAIGQTFYVGDGLTGFNNAGGSLQVWNVPSTATRLYLGFADSGTGPFAGAFGAYDDNSGSLSVTVTLGSATPEPDSMVLTGLGLAGLAVLLRRRIG